MYVLDPAKKQDPVRRWNLPDRIFFGHGACHILAGVYLKVFADSPLRPYRVQPREGLLGSHVFVTDGRIAFDYHGYSRLDRLWGHHGKVWNSQFPGWRADLLPVDFPLLDTAALNQRKMRGPDQYLGDPVARARSFIDRMNHQAAMLKVQGISGIGGVPGFEEGPAARPL